MSNDLVYVFLMVVTLASIAALVFGGIRNESGLREKLAKALEIIEGIPGIMKDTIEFGANKLLTVEQLEKLFEKFQATSDYIKEYTPDYIDDQLERLEKLVRELTDGKLKDEDSSVG